MTCPALIDFEASCLPEHGQSFPIEVVLARVDGASRSWLIQPAEVWRYWDWSAEAEALHGIRRDMLEMEGLPPVRVLAEMGEFVRGCQIYADADLDAYWLEVLAEAASVQVPFSVKYLGQFLMERGYTQPQVESALAEAEQRLPREHSARDDARRLALAVRLLMEGEGLIPFPRPD